MATVTGDSPEAVAYALMFNILGSEGKLASGMIADAQGKPTRAEILALYRTCLASVRDFGAEP